MPTDERTDFPESLDERSILLTMLDYTRRTAIAKCEGLSEEDARRAPLPTSPMMTMSGVVSHLRWVEWSWIDARLLGNADDDVDGPWTEEDPDREFHYRLDRPIAETISDYQAVAAEHDALFRDMDLDQEAASRMREGRTFTLRWVLHHLIEENARHNGHLDIIRELLDGTKGD
jgi:uncharacterized damage-inducible protein DinB